MANLKVGDRIVGIGTYQLQVIDKLTGTVKGPLSNSNEYPIEFDKEISGGHTCQDLCKQYHGYWVKETHLELPAKSYEGKYYWLEFEIKEK